MAIGPEKRKDTPPGLSPASRFVELWGPIRDFLTERSAYDMVVPASSVCVSIEKGGMWAAYVTKHKSRVKVEALKRFITDETSFPTPKEVANNTALFIGEAEISGVGTTLSIPKEWAVIRRADFPSSVKDNLPEVISFELDRITPFKTDEALYDFRLLGVEEERLTVLIVAAKSELLSGYLDALEENGVVVKRVTENRVSVAGEKISDPSVVEMLTSGFDMPVTLLDQGSIYNNFKDEKGEFPASAIGGGMGSFHPGGLNLIDKGLGKRGSKAPKIVTLALLILVILVWGLNMISPLKIAEKRGVEIDRQIAIRKIEVHRVMKLKKEAETLEEEISNINRFKDDSPVALNILKEITVTLPDSAWLTRLKIKGTNVDIQGNAESSAQLLPKLESSNYLKKVEFISPTLRDQRLKADRFNIKMQAENGDGKIRK